MSTMTFADRPLDHALQTLAVGARPERPGIRALVALDRRDRDSGYAGFLASLLPSGSRVRLLTVFSYQPQWDAPGGRLGFGNEPARVAAAEPEAGRAILEQAGIVVSTGRRFGYPADEILREAEDWNASLILVGHHNGADGWFLGSVTESVVKRARLPVLVVPTRTTGE